MPVLLHIGHRVSWTAWHIDLDIIAIIFVTCGLYLWTLSRGRSNEWWRPISFFGGLLLVFLALTSPLDAAASWLLSVHMVQHIILTTFAPPLLLLGLPPEGLRAMVPRSIRFQSLYRRFTSPFVAGTIFLLNMWIWHLPPLYEAALEHQMVHELMHGAFLATGLLYWLPVISPLRELSSTSGGARLLYLFVTGFPMGVLALLLLASEGILYDPYARLPSRLWGIDALSDQQVAGVVMGSVGEVVSFIAFSLIFVRFLLTDEQDQAAVESPVNPDRAGLW